MMAGLSRREALAAGAVMAGAAVAGAPARAASRLAAGPAEPDMLGLAELVRRKKASPGELLDDAIRKAGPAQEAWNFLARPLYERAKKVVADGLPDGPFKGVPFLVKDLNMAIAGERLGQGSHLYDDYRAPVSSTLVKRYEQAGLVIFGYTTTPEFGLTATTESAVTGATKNPWNPAYSSGGSSGGSAVAVAAGVVPGAHGSDGGGSIRIPSSACGLFGLKPSRGRVPIGPPQTLALGDLSAHHALTRTVRDSAALLDISHGLRPGSRYGAPPPERSYLSEVARTPGKLRIGFAPRIAGGAPAHPEVTKATTEAALFLEQLGHTVEEIDLPGKLADVAAAAFTLSGPSTTAACDARAKAIGVPLQDRVEPITYQILEATRAIRGTDVAAANAFLQDYAWQIDQLMEKYDVLLQPTLAVLPPKLGEISLSATGGMEKWGERAGAVAAFTSMWNDLGQPSMSVPFAHSEKEGLPIGVMFTGHYGAEGLLFRLAGQIERERPWSRYRPQHA